MPLSHAIEVDRAPGARSLTLNDVALWVTSMQAAGARPDAPVRARTTVGGWLTRLSAFPRTDDPGEKDG